MKIGEVAGQWIIVPVESIEALFRFEHRFAHDHVDHSPLFVFEKVFQRVSTRTEVAIENADRLGKISAVESPFGIREEGLILLFGFRNLDSGAYVMITEM